MNLKFSIVLLVCFGIFACKNNTAENSTSTSADALNTTNGRADVEEPLAKSPIVPNATQQKAGQEGWLSINDLSTIDNKEGKKYLIDLYTDWCGWCKVMDKKTFADPVVQEYLNDKFHLVKFNAEQKEPVTFKGKSYEWVAGGRNGFNQLAYDLVNGRMSYPTLVYLDKDMNPIKSSPGFKESTQLIEELKQLEN